MSPILTLNVGSSSIKFALFAGEEFLYRGKIERIGLEGTSFSLSLGGEVRYDLPKGGHKEALQVLFQWMNTSPHFPTPQEVVHRIVQGGPRYKAPMEVTRDLMEALHRFSPFDPEHLPHQISAIESWERHYPTIPQLVCFDTYFHRHMPQVAQHLPLPRRFGDEGVVRFGFHGLSYASILSQLRKESPGEAEGRVVVAHLGNGASMAAIEGGKGVDTTMGFSPAGGLVMSTRTGDLDPGVFLYLVEKEGGDPQRLRALLNEKSGLLGVSGWTSDMRDLLERPSPEGDEAVNLFCYTAKKALGGLIAVLGGLDTLVFTAGIGENAPAIRQQICGGLEGLGITLDPRTNRDNAPMISKPGERVKVRVMHTDEEREMVEEVLELLLRR